MDLNYFFLWYLYCSEAATGHSDLRSLAACEKLTQAIALRTRDYAVLLWNRSLILSLLHSSASAVFHLEAHETEIESLPFFLSYASRFLSIGR
jgi:hypothetical protein